MPVPVPPCRSPSACSRLHQTKVQCSSTHHRVPPPHADRHQRVRKVVPIEDEAGAVAQRRQAAHQHGGQRRGQLREQFKFGQEARASGQSGWLGWERQRHTSTVGSAGGSGEWRRHAARWKASLCAALCCTSHPGRSGAQHRPAFHTPPGRRHGRAVAAVLTQPAHPPPCSRMTFGRGSAASCS